MRTDAEIDAFFSGLASRRDELARRYRAGWPLGLAGCGIGCLLPIGLLLAFIGFRDRWQGHPLYTTGTVAACLVALASLGIGLALYQRAQRIYEPVDAAVTADLLAPLAAFLVPGATLERHGLEDSVEWRPSLLFPRAAHPHEHAVSRVTGRLAGLPTAIDEMLIRFRNDSDSSTFTGWVARLELPFTVGGHVRVRIPARGYGSLMWNEGFEPMPDAQARLGTRHEIDAAAPGVAPEGAEGATASGVPVDVLLTDALFGLLQARPRMQLAATGRTLWVAVQRMRVFEPRSGVVLFGKDAGRQAAADIADLEAIAREIVRAGSGRG